ncbi:MAG: hypothetical protein ISS64_00220 [Desulfobacterales bacterium]|nr:hypothetical protein [Desulfobacterales bacterium]
MTKSGVFVQALYSGNMEKRKDVMALTKMKGVIFDLDGVITGTARVHALAWESMFNGFLKKNAEKENIP